MGFSKCPHAWQKAGHTTVCPYGKSLFEVTWPNLTRMELEDQAVGLPKSSGEFIYICALYGYIPYVIFFLSYVEFLVRRGTRELSSATFLGMVTLLNEVIFKNLVMQARPERSCLSSCGMPSGHSTMAVGLLTMCLLDTALRVSYRPDQDILARAVFRGGGCLYWRLACRYLCRELVQKFTFLPLSTWDELSHLEAVLYSTCWFILLFPVPLARVTTRDHTVEQVMIGSLIGFTEAVCWCYFAYNMQHRYNHLLGKTWNLRNGIVVLTHNYALPRFVAEQRVRAIPKDPEAERCTCAVQRVSRDPEAELRWYELATSRRCEAVERLGELRSPSAGAREIRAEREYLKDRERGLQRLRATIKPMSPMGSACLGDSRRTSAMPDDVRRSVEAEAEDLEGTFASSRSREGSDPSGLSGSRIELGQAMGTSDPNRSSIELCQGTDANVLSGSRIELCQAAPAECLMATTGSSPRFSTGQADTLNPNEASAESFHRLHTPPPAG